MKNVLTILTIGVLATTANAVTYNDSIGDILPSNSILDIVSMDVTNDLSNITFKFTLVGDVVATDWGKYMVGIDKAPGGDPAGNGWGRPISQPSGMDIWLGSWVDGGNGLEDRQYVGGAWTLNGATYNGTPNLSIGKTTNTVTLQVGLANLGLVPGDIIFFDAFSSGGGSGDGAIDSLANPNQSIANWGDAYAYGPGSNNPELTYLVVPEPATLTALGLGALALIRRRR